MAGKRAESVASPRTQAKRIPQGERFKQEVAGKRAKAAPTPHPSQANPAGRALQAGSGSEARQSRAHTALKPSESPRESASSRKWQGSAPKASPRLAPKPSESRRESAPSRKWQRNAPKASPRLAPKPSESRRESASQQAAAGKRTKATLYTKLHQNQVSSNTNIKRVPEGRQAIPRRIP
ncbi:hypothetical protein J22TS3_08030 [Paenibacillus sp. J22TS3]|nr:hypothetical protein J22TS3_08030 [Paenibacillus sp. J22TS3]